MSGNAGTIYQKVRIAVSKSYFVNQYNQLQPTNNRNTTVKSIDIALNKKHPFSWNCNLLVDDKKRVKIESSKDIPALSVLVQNATKQFIKGRVET